MTRVWPYKDPLAEADYGIDWSVKELLGPIARTSCAVVSGTVSVDAHGIAPSGSDTTTWLSGGTLGERCELVLKIEVDVDDAPEPQKFKQTVFIDIKNR